MLQHPLLHLPPLPLMRPGLIRVRWSVVGKDMELLILHAGAGLATDGGLGQSQNLGGRGKVRLGLMSSLSYAQWMAEQLLRVERRNYKRV